MDWTQRVSVPALFGALGWFILALLLRARTIDDLDTANFLHGLTHYDLSLNMPHFPGYPVYIALSRVAASLVGDSLLALQLPGLVALAVALVLVEAAVRRHAGPWAGALVMSLAALSPLVLLTAGRGSSDALGTAIVVSAASLLALAWPVDGVRSEGERPLLRGATLLLGLSIGVRLSYLPLVAALLVVAWLHPRRRLVGFSVGLALWIVPFALVVGTDLPQLALSFLGGHFGHWGGTVAVTGDPLGRLGSWLTSFCVQAMAMPTAGGSAVRWLAFPLLITLVAAGLSKLEGHRRLWLGLLCAPYGLWLWLGQNPDKPRHLLPLAVVAAVVAGLSLMKVKGKLGGRRWAWGSGLGTLTIASFILASVSLPLGLAHSTRPSPQAQLAAYLARHYPLEGTQLFSGSSERVTSVYQPGYRVEYAGSMAEVERRLGFFTFRPPVLLLTDEVDEAEGKAVATFRRDPLINPHRASITLLEVEP
jgi:hypothetical protein